MASHWSRFVRHLTADALTPIEYSGGLKSDASPGILNAPCRSTVHLFAVHRTRGLSRVLRAIHHFSASLTSFAT
jgi:hypothetical protein